MELWDLYSPQRTPLGRTHLRGQPLPEGCFHLVVHVWIQNRRGEYLISQRSPDRPTFPLMWETTGGSVLQGEDSLTGALREAREELGIDLDPETGRLVFSETRQRFGDIVDVWLFPWEGPANLEQADGEAVQARWMSREEVRGMLDRGEMVNTLAYFWEELGERSEEN